VQKATPGQVVAATDSQKESNKAILRLAGSVGVPDGHASAPAEIRLNLARKEARSSAAAAFSQSLGPNSPTMSIVSSLSGAAPGTHRSVSPMSEDDIRSKDDEWPFKEALQTKRLVLVEDCSALIKGYPTRVWDELPNAAVIVPIANDSDEGVPRAVLVIGLSVRRPFDDDYEAWIVSFCDDWC
jgi:hypothetical protein